MQRLCTICARGGSKGVPNKNIRDLVGKPLIAHTIEQAKASRLFAKIAVSSDSDEILAVAKKFGADFLIKRPPELASDQSAKIPAIQHCALSAENLAGQVFDTYVDLDCTSPLRNQQDLLGAVAQFEANPKADNLITGAPARRSPYFNLVELSSDNYVSLSKKLAHQVLRRQDSPKCFDMNGSIYIWRREVLMQAQAVLLDKTIIYIMPEERSVDIDTELDFKIVEMILNDRR